MPGFDEIRPGGRFTGKGLKEMLELAARPPVGGRGIRVESYGPGNHTIQYTKRRIVSRATIFEVILLDMPAPGEFASNRWDYAWEEAMLNVDNEWIGKPQGRRWDDPNSREARNRTEVGNTDLIVQHGIVLDQTSGTPGFILTIEPLPSGTEVELSERLDENGDRAYWFTAYNQLKTTCGGPAPVLPPPPSPSPSTSGARVLP